MILIITKISWKIYRWSAIAAKLPGRTDNEIKNVWHTHLKKRLPKQIEPDQTGSDIATTDTTVVPTKKRARKSRTTKKGGIHEEAPPRKHMKCMDNLENDNNNNDNNNNDDDNDPTSSLCDPVSPQPCTSEVSTITSTSASENDNCSKENVGEKDGYIGDFPEINDDFWMEVLSVEDTTKSTDDLHCISPDVLMPEPMRESDPKVHSDDMDFFWYNLLTRSDDLPEFFEML